MTRPPQPWPPTVLPPQSEKDFQKAVVKLANVLGWLVFHPWTSMHSAAGWPDLFMVRKGKCLAAELKTQRGRVSEAQEAWLSSLALCGIETFVWRPGDWPEICAVLR